jgi:hypothetical protein
MIAFFAMAQLLNIGVNAAALPQILYRSAFVLTVVAYMLLLIFPRQTWTNFWLVGIIFPTILGLEYMMFLIYYFLNPTPCEQVFVNGAWFQHSCPAVSSFTDFLSLDGLRNLFHKDGVLMAEFLNLLLVPMMAAAWMARKAQQIRMPYVYVLPCILLCMAAPGIGVWVWVLLAGLRGRLGEIPKYEGAPPIQSSAGITRLAVLAAIAVQAAGMLLLFQPGVTLTSVPRILYTWGIVLTAMGYVALLLFPKQTWSNYWLAGITIPTILGIEYGMALLYYFGTATPCEQVDVNGVIYSLTCPQFSSPTNFLWLEGLRTLFHKDGLLLAGFLDLLLMPLMMAAWMTRKAQQVSMPRYLLAPCVLLCAAAPGIGVFLYTVLAGFRGRLVEMPKFEGAPPLDTSPVFARAGAGD